MIYKLSERDIKIQKQIQHNKIQNSRYDTRYIESYTMEISEYLRKRGQRDF